MSTWYDQLVGSLQLDLCVLGPELGQDVCLTGLMGVPTVTGCLCVQDCWTALISAAKEGHIEVVRELLENNANLEHRDMVRT